MGHRCNPAGSPTRRRSLTEAAREDVKARVDASRPLPTAYRDRLFLPSSEPTPARAGEGTVLAPADPEAGRPALRTVERVLPAALRGTATTAPSPSPSPEFGGGEAGSLTSTGPDASILAPRPPLPAPPMWRDRLVLGDGAALLAAIADGPLRDEVAAVGGLRLAYLDPPFATGGSFAMDVPIGERDGGARRTVRVPAYGDAWGRGLAGYLAAMAPLLRGIHGLLADDGSLYVHCDHRANAALRRLLDGIFGPGRLVNELIWTYGLGNAGGARAFARKHDTILFYAKTDRYRFNRPRGAVTPAMLAKYRHVAPDGTRTMRSYGKTYALKGGKPVGSVWDDVPALAPTDRERLGYPTQKPEALLERIVLASSDPGDLVADLCCGSGTTPAVAARLGRRWLACDASPLAVATTRTRLVGVGRRRAASGEPVAGFDVAELVGAGAAGVAGRISCRLPSYQIRVRAAAEVVDGATTVRLIEARAVATEGASDPETVGAALRPGRSALALDRGRLVRLARDRAGTLTREALTEHWSEWVEGWAVGVAGEEADEPLRTAWTTARVRHERNLCLTSDGLSVAGAEAPRVRVRVFDPFGGWTDTAVTLSAKE